MCLPCKYRDLSSTPQQSTYLETPGIVVVLELWRPTNESLGLAVLRASEGLSLKEADCVPEDDTKVVLCSPHIIVHACMCTHTH